MIITRYCSPIAWVNSSLVGLLILGTELSEADTETFCSLTLPTVILDCDIYGCKTDTVTIHKEYGIWRGMNCLYEQGHRNIRYFRNLCLKDVKEISFCRCRRLKVLTTTFAL